MIKVKKVIDGDTFQDSRNRFYRLADVDAPDNRKVVVARIPGEKTTINVKMNRKL